MAGDMVLVVDDNPTNLKLARDVLEHSGWRVLAAATAADGIELARRHRPDVILMDIQLPDLDGLSALRELRSDDGTQSIPVVAVTAFAMKGDEQRFLDGGFDGYLAKPIDIRRFPEQVQSFIR